MTQEYLGSALGHGFCDYSSRNKPPCFMDFGIYSVTFENEHTWVVILFLHHYYSLLLSWRNLT